MKSPTAVCSISPSGYSARRIRRLLGTAVALALSASTLLLSAHAQAADPARGIVADPRTPFFHLESSRAVGDRGEFQLDVSVPTGQCGQYLVFERAEIEVLRNRFGDVQFMALPERGCEVCSPVVVRWMHEPTGHLEFNINVYRRLSETACPVGP